MSPIFPASGFRIAALQHKVKEVSKKELVILIQILKAIQEEGGKYSGGKEIIPVFFQTNQSVYSIAWP